MGCDWRCYRKSSKEYKRRNCKGCPADMGKEDVMAGRRQDARLIEDCNRLAATFHRQLGHDVPSSHKFYRSADSDERTLWDLAVKAYEYIDGADVLQALTKLRGRDESKNNKKSTQCKTQRLGFKCR